MFCFPKLRINENGGNLCQSLEHKFSQEALNLWSWSLDPLDFVDCLKVKWQNYSLVQVCFASSADMEHKPDIVWPHSDQIIISAVSECGSFIAMGLKTGTVVVWDVYRGESCDNHIHVRVIVVYSMRQFFFYNANKLPISGRAKTFFTQVSVYIKKSP